MSKAGLAELNREHQITLSTSSFVLCGWNKQRDIENQSMINAVVSRGFLKKYRKIYNI